MSDVMRQQYRKLSDAEQAAMQKLKADAAAIYDDITGYGSSRELSVAKTKLEEAVMWAVKHITGVGIGGDDGGVKPLDGGGTPGGPPPK